jgi:hypothetical protein
MIFFCMQLTNINIDPAFPELIKAYLAYLKFAQLPAHEGYICPPDISLEVLERNGYPALDKQYEKNPMDALKGLKEIKRLVASNSMGIIARDITKNIQKSGFEMLEALQEGESKSYYTKKFRPFRSEKETRQFIKGMSADEIMDFVKELASDMTSLYLHLVTITFPLHQNAENRKKAKADKINVLLLVKVNLASIYSMVAQLVFKTTMQKLIEDGKKGDDDALFKAIRVDKTLFNSEWVRKRIIVAQYKGQVAFFNQLGDAIKKTPLQNDQEYMELLLVLVQFWKMGLYRLSNKDLIAVLESAGVTIQDNAETFRTYVDRLKNEGILIY